MLILFVFDSSVKEIPDVEWSGKHNFMVRNKTHDKACKTQVDKLKILDFT